MVGTCTGARLELIISVGSGKKPERFVCFQQIVVDRLQVAKHHVTTIIGIATEVVMQVEGVCQSIAGGQSNVEQLIKALGGSLAQA